MRPGYEWQKGEDAWDEAAVSAQALQWRAQGQPLQGRAQGQPLQGRAQGRPLQWRVVLVIVIISLIGASVFWFVNRRARTNTAAVEVDILRTNALVFQAMNAGDVELLRNNLSGRIPEFQRYMQFAAERGLFYDRSFWGLSAGIFSPEDGEVEIVLNPEWDSAEVTVPITYETVGGGTTVLEQTLLYRRSQEKWLLAPPDIGYWGTSRLFERRYLLIEYPERDREIVERLGADLDGIVGEICGAGGGCGDDFQIGIAFGTWFPDYYITHSPIRQSPCYLNNTLPTPSFIGLPVDESGYEALLDGYRAEVAAMTLGRLLYKSDCPDSPLVIALLDYRLSEMGFRQWPIGSGDYEQLWREQFHLEQMFYALQADEGTALNYEGGMLALRPYYALVEFLTEVYGTPLDEIEGYIDLGRLGRNRYWSTLHNWTDGNFAADGPLEEAWERFLVEKAGIETADAPELPDQNLRLVCYGGDITTGIAYPSGVLYELDVAEERLTAFYPLNHTDAYMTSLPGDEGVIVAEQRLDFVRENGRVLLWEGRRTAVLFETADNLVPVSFFDFRGLGEQFLVYNRQEGRYGGYLLAECVTGEGCNWTDFGGFPIISPSGEGFMSLISLGNHGYEGRFFRPFGVGRLMTLTDALVGRSPFWLSDERIGWVGEDGRTVMALTVAGEDYPEEREVLFTLAEVDPLLALDEGAMIEAVVPRPEEREDLLVTVRDGAGWVSIYQVNILRRWIQPLQEEAFLLDSETVYSFDLSPEGRWLVVSGNDTESSTAYVHLLSMSGNEVHSYEYKMVFYRPMHWAMDWSAGDEWLALPDNGYIRLINPAEDYQDVIVPEGVGCSGAVWVNNNE